MDDRLLGVKEICQITGVTRHTIYRWMDSGQIPFIRIQNRRYALRSELLKAWEANNDEHNQTDR